MAASTDDAAFLEFATNAFVYHKVNERPQLDRFDTYSWINSDLVTKCNFTFVAVTFAFLALRLWLRTHRKIFNSEDVYLIVAWVVFTAAMTLEVKAYLMQEEFIEYFWGIVREFYHRPGGPGSVEDIQILRPNPSPQTLRMGFAMKVLYYTPLYLVKFAWIRFYYTLIPVISAKTRLYLHATLILSVVGYVCTTFMTIFSCFPLSRVWDYRAMFFQPEEVELPDGTKYWTRPYTSNSCSPFQNRDVLLTTFVFHALTEIMVYTVPLCLIFRLQNISLMKRMSVAVLFFLGFFCLVLAVFNTLLSTTILGFNTPWPLAWCLVSAEAAGVFWPMEPAWAIVVTCLPAFKVFMDRSATQVKDVLRSKLSHGSDSDLGMEEGYNTYRSGTFRSVASWKQGFRTSVATITDRDETRRVSNGSTIIEPSPPRTTT